MNLGPITKEEIKKAAQKIKTGKAPGQQHFPGSHEIRPWNHSRHQGGLAERGIGEGRNTSRIECRLYNQASQERRP